MIAADLVADLVAAVAPVADQLADVRWRDATAGERLAVRNGHVSTVCPVKAALDGDGEFQTTPTTAGPAAALTVLDRVLLGGLDPMRGAPAADPPSAFRATYQEQLDDWPWTWARDEASPEQRALLAAAANRRVSGIARMLSPVAAAGGGPHRDAAQLAAPRTPAPAEHQGRRRPRPPRRHPHPRRAPRRRPRRRDAAAPRLRRRPRDREPPTAAGGGPGTAPGRRAGLDHRRRRRRAGRGRSPPRPPAPAPPSAPSGSTPPGWSPNPVRRAATAPTGTGANRARRGSEGPGGCATGSSLPDAELARRPPAPVATGDFLWPCAPPTEPADTTRTRRSDERIGCRGRLPGIRPQGRRVADPRLLRGRRTAGHRGRLPADEGRAGRRAGHPEDDRDRPGHPGGRLGVPQAPVPHHRRHPRAPRRHRVHHVHGDRQARRHHRPDQGPVGPLPHPRVHRRLLPVGPHRLHRHDAWPPGATSARPPPPSATRCPTPSWSRSARAASPACSPSAWACSAPRSSSSSSRTPAPPSSSASASAARCSPSSCESAAASSPRRPTSAPTSSARSRPASPRTTPATRPPSPTTWATTSATAPAWPRTSSRATRSPSSPRSSSASPASPPSAPTPPSASCSRWPPGPSASSPPSPASTP